MLTNAGAAERSVVVKVLLFGLNGQVGSVCAEVLSSQASEGLSLIALDRREADFSNPQSVYDAVVESAPDVVVNAVAYTAVDRAESDSELAFLVNRDSVKSLAEACAHLSIPAIHLSTDYVFGGDASSPYTESDPVSPMGVYGESKLAGENALISTNPQHMILRTSWVFGVHGANFVKTMLRLGRERDSLGVVADQFGCPTYAGHLALVVEALIQRFRSEGTLPWGVYHCSGGSPCSWHEFAQQVFQISAALKEQGVGGELLPDASPAVKPIATEDYPTPAARPQYSVLDNRKLEELLGRELPCWRDGLLDMLSKLQSAS